MYGPDLPWFMAVLLSITAIIWFATRKMDNAFVRNANEAAVFVIASPLLVAMLVLTFIVRGYDLIAERSNQKSYK
jgi:hypothetical protein